VRAISTVLDVTVCLLLISAAVFVLALPITEPPPDRGADETAAVLSTTTVDLEYRLSTEQFGAGDETDRKPLRTRHGTLAGLAGRAALASLAVGGKQVAPETAGFREAVTANIGAATPARTFVTAHWEPYPGATVSGRIEAGPEPPEAADVQAATRRVPLPALAAEPGTVRGEPAVGGWWVWGVVDGQRQSGEPHGGRRGEAGEPPVVGRVGRQLTVAPLWTDSATVDSRPTRDVFGDS